MIAMSVGALHGGEPYHPNLTTVFVNLVTSATPAHMVILQNAPMSHTVSRCSQFFLKEI
jgi:hypothetical protein